MERFYPIGTPGLPWTDADKATWFTQQSRRRSYRDQVLAKIEALRPRFQVTQYGALEPDPDRYPLFAVECRATAPDRPWALITGGVHGYETSGVQGALAFLAEHAEDYLDRINLLVAPCVSPWAYEVIHRWNCKAIDPNRSFVPDTPCDESRALMQLVRGQFERDESVRGRGVSFLMHVDLHETTDTDESEFRPAKAARDGVEPGAGLIPDGFYTVGDIENPQPAFQAAIIAAVEKVTHIAPADANGQIIEEDVTQKGVINYAARELGLCMGLTGAPFTTTTEVYPDSPRVTDDECNRAQIAALRGALDHVLAVPGPEAT
ncbi:MAG: M14 family metallocarboxypeptidase [Planctomycetes bacterium]|nr:M14 family metallocarboxypeptidase [Planctomycetota bacterium]